MAELAHTRAKELYKYARKVASEQRPLAGVQGNQQQYEKRLETTVEKLEAQLRSEQQKLKLKEERTNQSLLISIESQSEDANTLLRQRKVIAAAYRRLAASKPTDLPHPKTSALPALLALRSVSDATSGIRALIPSAHQDLKATREELEEEKSDLGAFIALGRTLESRIGELEAQRESRAALSIEDIARKHIAGLEDKTNRLHEEANMLASELRWFLKAHLAPMIAAEAAGGPPVGDLLDVSDMTLGAGFSESTRKPKPVKESESDREVAARGKELKLAMYNELRSLMQDLLNAATDASERKRGGREEEGEAMEVEAGADGSGKETTTSTTLNGESAKGWVEVREDSRAAQYLITAKVAMFHPTDARRIRLLDFAS